MNYRTIQRGWYDINGKNIYFRSKAEANYALYLDWLQTKGDIQSWEHEPQLFIFEKIKFGTRSYLPDFRVYERRGNSVFYEIKGRMDSKSATKLKRMAKYFPNEKVILVDWETYVSIAKNWGKLLKFY